MTEKTIRQEAEEYAALFDNARTPDALKNLAREIWIGGARAMQRRTREYHLHAARSCYGQEQAALANSNAEMADLFHDNGVKHERHAAAISAIETE